MEGEDIEMVPGGSSGDGTDGRGETRFRADGRVTAGPHGHRPLTGAISTSLQ